MTDMALLDVSGLGAGVLNTPQVGKVLDNQELSLFLYNFQMAFKLVLSLEPNSVLNTPQCIPAGF